MGPEKGKYGLWYAGTVGFATKEEAQEYIDRGMRHYNSALDDLVPEVAVKKSKTGTYVLLSIVAVAALAYGAFQVAVNSRNETPTAQVEPRFVRTEPSPKSQDVRLNEIKLQRLVRSWVVAGLKDPDSAKFRNQYGVCGEVNAKNALGGYVGYRRFIAVREDLVVVDDGLTTSPADFEKVWASSCDSSPTGSARLPQ
ncbi:MAG TPA: hypothetical protein VF285_00935 [Castellaniella sp.]|uniref:hypothetical protein n=1 Tax=Castellaniella sp. TaxID=1955812 RepID=UPI002EFFBA92